MTISKMYGTAVIKKNEISAQIPCISIAVQRKIQKNKYRNMVTIASLVVLSFFRTFLPTDSASFKNN